MSAKRIPISAESDILEEAYIPSFKKRRAEREIYRPPYGGRGRFGGVPGQWAGPGFGAGFGEVDTSSGDFKMNVGDRRFSAYGDWRDDPKWSHLQDTARVRYNPTIEDRLLWNPRADLFDEGGDLIRAEFELPGVPREDISLTVKDNVITVCALKPQTRKEENAIYFHRERHFGRFYRHLASPVDLDETTTRAVLDNGVLKVTIHKKGVRRVDVVAATTTGLHTAAPTTQ